MIHVTSAHDTQPQPQGRARHAKHKVRKYTHKHDARSCKTHKHIYTHQHTYTHTKTNTNAHTYTHTPTPTHTHQHTHPHTSTHPHQHTHPHTSTHPHPHTHQGAQGVKQELLAVLAVNAHEPVVAVGVMGDVDLRLAGLHVFVHTQACLCVRVCERVSVRVCACVWS